MEKLFNDTEVFTKERPLKPTPQQLDAFYLKMAKEILKEGYSHSNEDDIIEDLKNLSLHYNGFEMGKYLDSLSAEASYDIDVAFCEWLDCLPSEYHQINQKNVEDWVKAHNPLPKFKKGQKLLVNILLCYGYGVGKTFYITGINEKQAYYTIDENPDRNGGTVLAYERVEDNCEIID